MMRGAMSFDVDEMEHEPHADLAGAWNASKSTEQASAPCPLQLPAASGSNSTPLRSGSAVKESENAPFEMIPVISSTCGLIGVGAA